MPTQEDIVLLSQQFSRGTVSWDRWVLLTCKSIMTMEEKTAKEFAGKLAKIGEEDRSNV
jgi:hypothetical protein